MARLNCHDGSGFRGVSLLTPVPLPGPLGAHRPGDTRPLTPQCAVECDVECDDLMPELAGWR